MPARSVSRAVLSFSVPSAGSSCFCGSSCSLETCKFIGLPISQRHVRFTDAPLLPGVMGDKECVRGDVDSQRTKGRARKKSIRSMKKGLDLRSQISDLRPQGSDFRPEMLGYLPRFSVRAQRSQKSEV